MQLGRLISVSVLLTLCSQCVQPCFARVTDKSKLSLSTGVPAAAKSAGPGKAVADQLMAVFRDAGPGPLRKETIEKAAPLIDYNLLARRSLGEAEWNKLTAQQRTDLAEAIEYLVEVRYYKRWQEIFRKSKFTFMGEEKRGNDIVVVMQLDKGRKDYTLYWKLAPVNGSAKVYSLNVDSKDLAEKLGKRLRKSIKKSGFSKTLTALRTKGDDE